MAHKGKTGEILIRLPRVDFEGPGKQWAKELIRTLEKVLRKGVPGSVAHLDSNGKIPPTLMAGGNIDNMYNGTDFKDD